MSKHDFECRGCGEKVSDEDSYDYDVSLCTSCGELRDMDKRYKAKRNRRAKKLTDLAVFWAKEDSDGN